MPISSPLFNRKQELQEEQGKLQSLQSRQYSADPSGDLSIATQLGAQGKMTNDAIGAYQGVIVEKLRKGVQDEFFNLLTKQEAGVDKYLSSVRERYGDNVMKFIPPKELFYSEDGVFQPVEYYDKALSGVAAYKPLYEAEQKAKQMGVQASTLQKVLKHFGLENEPGIASMMAVQDYGGAADRTAKVVDDSKEMEYKKERDTISDMFKRIDLNMANQRFQLDEKKFSEQQYEDIRNVLDEAQNDLFEIREKAMEITGTDSFKKALKEMDENTRDMFNRYETALKTRYDSYLKQYATANKLAIEGRSADRQEIRARTFSKPPEPPKPVDPQLKQIEIRTKRWLDANGVSEEEGVQNLKSAIQSGVYDEVIRSIPDNMKSNPAVKATINAGLMVNKSPEDILREMNIELPKVDPSKIFEGAKSSITADKLRNVGASTLKDNPFISESRTSTQSDYTGQ